jgi:zinc transport system substrate-binding protein
VVCAILIVGLVVGAVAVGIWKLAGNRKSGGEVDVLATNFIGYDLARAVVGDAGVEASMLLKPGAEMHDFEPTPEDIIKIREADLFVYVGGESDEWVEEMLSDNEISKDKVLRLMDLVEVKEEELVEGMEEGHEDEDGHEHADEKHADGGHEDEEHVDEEHADKEEHEHTDGEVEYDEHVWTSPVNAMKMVDGVREKLATIYPEKAEAFARNAEEYNARLMEIDRKIREAVAEGARKELIFGDRFPFRYFVDEYGLDYYAAFPGCSEQTEASSQTIAFLIDKAKAEGVKVILKIELTSDKLAQTIADEVGAKVLTLNAAHNISQKDFERGVTYAEIMEGNIKVLREALE